MLQQSFARTALRAFLALAVCAALALVLASCGSTATDEQKANFIGTWNMVSTDAGDGSQSVSEDDVKAANANGFYTTLTVSEDGSLNFTYFDGTSHDGIWSARNGTSATAKLDNESMDMTVTEDGLTLSQGKAVLSFERADD